MSSLYPSPPKPEWAAPCNGCGVCCLAQTCWVGQSVFEIGEHDRCPALAWVGGKFRCRVIEMSPFMAFRLGAGIGCDSNAPAGTVAG
jgi:hypothetical protein